MKITIYEGSI